MKQQEVIEEYVTGFDGIEQCSECGHISSDDGERHYHDCRFFSDENEEESTPDDSAELEVPTMPISRTIYQACWHAAGSHRLHDLHCRSVGAMWYPDLQWLEECRYALPIIRNEGCFSMTHVRTIGESGSRYFSRYPAILSGYVIYLVVSILRLYIKVRYYGGSLADVYDVFSALPFMWILSVSLIKLIDYRSRLHDGETRRMKGEEELQTKATWLETMHRVV
jgi:hypothetical protein